MSAPPEPAEFVLRLFPALRQAACIARALEGRVANRPKRGESSEVKAALTVADTAAQEAFLVPVLEHFPGVSLEAEEDTPTVAHFPEVSESRVVVDPIDGTLRFFLEGLGPYACMIGLAIHGAFRAALVALPREGILLDAAAGQGIHVARLDPSEPARPFRALTAERAPILISHDLPEAARARLHDAGLEPLPACGGAIAIAPLLPGVRAGLRLAPAGNGVSVRGRIGVMISREAGLTVRREGGAPFPEGLSEPARALLVCREERDLQAMQAALGAIGVD